MKKELRKNGFSLMEVLIAAVILAAGLVMIAGTFPVAIFLTAGSVEQTIAPIVTDEAFAKIRLYGVNVAGLLPAITTTCDDFNNVNGIKSPGVNIDPNEYLYPSDNSISVYNRVYNWSAICRRVNAAEPLVQVTVFVNRKTGSGLQYYRHDTSGNIINDGSWPVPVKITISAGTGANQIQVTQKFITDGCTIVADASGNIFRVLDHAAVATGIEVTLDRSWNFAANGDGTVGWIVPPPTNGGRSPCIGVYQRIIKF
ncbi:MAG: prepilin-type N-terminal cleavage/methylation domain-containing protein [Sedimentisphaerales bacterium]|nr:prepilin-type N-terminal cleavage/methylation domain-containing protein [Sedimentisphaerales bacterium]